MFWKSAFLIYQLNAYHVYILTKKNQALRRIPHIQKRLLILNDIGMLCFTRSWMNALVYCTGSMILCKYEILIEWWLCDSLNGLFVYFRISLKNWQNTNSSIDKYGLVKPLLTHTSHMDMIDMTLYYDRWNKTGIRVYLTILFKWGVGGIRHNKIN